MLARRRRDLVVVVGLGWLAASLAGALLLRYDELGWWLGHGLEVGGILLVGAPVAFDLFRDAPSRPLLGDLRGSELVAKEEAFLGADVHGLTRRLAEKDTGTETHTRRVALLAVQVGEELGLPAHRLRHLAIGGLLHDIGKLGVPDAILKKPGPLDDDEFREIQRHPAAARGSSASSASARASAASCSTTTSGSTARATRAGSAGGRSSSTRRSSPSATCTTR